jgi:uncharacterized protein (TIGR03437 family)
MAAIVHLRTPQVPPRPDCQQFGGSLLKKLNSILSLILTLVTAGALGAQTLTVDKTSMSFSGQAGGAAVNQTLAVGASAGSPQFFISSNATWLRVNNAASAGPITAPTTVTVTADPSGLTAQTYSGLITILSTGNQPNINIPVSFAVGSVGVSPTTISFSYQASGAVPNAATLTLTSATTIAVTAAATTATGGNWLAVTSAANSPGTLAVSLNNAVLTALAPGTYNGTVTVTPASGPPITVAVTLTVTAAPTVTSSASSVNLNYQIGGASGATNSASTVVTLTNPGTQDLSFGIATSPNGTWLSASPSTGGTIPANSTAQVTISYVTAQGLAAGTYNGQATIFLPGAANQTINIPVVLRVSASPLLNVPNGTQSFTYQVGSATPAAKTVITTSSAVAADAATGQMTLLITKSDNSNWLVIPSSGLTGSANPITIAVNPAGLAVGTYNATVSVFGNGAANNPQTIPVTLSVSNDPLIVATYGGCSTANTACTLNFPIQIGQTQTTVQNVRVTTSTGSQASFTATANMTTPACGSAWLSAGVVAAVLGTEATFPITVSPGTTPITCEGTISIAGTNPTTGAALPNSPVTIPVRLYVSSSAMLVANPIALNFSLAPNATSTQQQIAVTSTSSVNLDFNATTAAPWLLVFPLAGNTTAGSNAITVVANSSGLNPGTYSTTITLTAVTAGVQNSPITIPVTLTVTAATMTVTPTTLSFTQPLGAAPPAAQTLRVSTSSTDINFSTNVTMQQGAGWLSATPAVGTATLAAPANVSVNVNGSNLPAGTYNGTVTITAPGAAGSPTNVAVTLVVQPGTVSASPASLTFSQVQGGTAPATQNVTVTGTPGALAYTVAATTASGGNWLTATPASGNTNSSVTVSANSGTLAPGTYTGTVTVTSTGASGSPIAIPVTLTVVPAVTFTVAPTTLSFNYIVGATTPAPQTVQLTASAAGTPFTATATTQSGGNWLQVTPPSAAGSGTMTVIINPASLTTAGTYTGAIAISSPNAATNPAATVNVTITVTQVPKPVINSVGNAASYVAGAVSPGENIVLFGSGIGPATLTAATLSNNSFPTTLGSTQVFFDNIAAPIIYARADQTSVMVPYGVAGRATTNIRVVYSGVQSDTIAYNVVAATPGIYTANASGSGQGAILNQDFTVNAAARPAAKGSVVTIYLTGEGVTSPASVDGRIAPIDGSGLFKPLLPVTATIGGQAATVEYYGTAPGIVYGVMQVNLRIPANAATGNLAVSIGVGSNTTQPNVTVAVQ